MQGITSSHQGESDEHGDEGECASGEPSPAAPSPSLLSRMTGPEPLLQGSEPAPAPLPEQLAQGATSSHQGEPDEHGGKEECASGEPSPAGASDSKANKLSTTPPSATPHLEPRHALASVLTPNALLTVLSVAASDVPPPSELVPHGVLHGATALRGVGLYAVLSDVRPPSKPLNKNDKAGAARAAQRAAELVSYLLQNAKIEGILHCPGSDAQGVVPNGPGHITLVLQGENALQAADHYSFQRSIESDSTRAATALGGVEEDLRAPHRSEILKLLDLRDRSNGTAIGATMCLINVDLTTLWCLEDNPASPWRINGLLLAIQRKPALGDVSTFWTGYGRLPGTHFSLRVLEVSSSMRKRGIGVALWQHLHLVARPGSSFTAEAPACLAGGAVEWWTNRGWQASLSEQGQAASLTFTKDVIASETLTPHNARLHTSGYTLLSGRAEEILKYQREHGETLVFYPDGEDGGPVQARTMTDEELLKHIRKALWRIKPGRHARGVVPALVTARWDNQGLPGRYPDGGKDPRRLMVRSEGNGTWAARATEYLSFILCAYHLDMPEIPHFARTRYVRLAEQEACERGDKSTSMGRMVVKTTALANIPVVGYSPEGMQEDGDQKVHRDEHVSSEELKTMPLIDVPLRYACPQLPGHCQTVSRLVPTPLSFAQHGTGTRRQHSPRHGGSDDWHDGGGKHPPRWRHACLCRSHETLWPNL